MRCVPALPGTYPRNIISATEQTKHNGPRSRKIGKMRRSNENILEEGQPETHMKVPVPTGVPGAYRKSLESHHTFASATTRDSTVMPTADANLGVADYEVKNMDAKQLLKIHGSSKAGLKNKEILGNQPLDFMDAEELNKEVTKSQNLAILQKIVKREENEKVEERKKKTKVFLAIFAFGAVVALIAFIGYSANAGTSNDDEENEENDPSQVAVLMNNVELDEFSFQVLCSQSSESFENVALCLNSKIVSCQEGNLVNFDCECECESKLAQDLSCESNDGCSLDFSVTVPSGDEKEVLENIIEVSQSCENEINNEGFCAFEKYFFECNDFNLFQTQECAQNCIENGCEPVEI